MVSRRGSALEALKIYSDEIGSMELTDILHCIRVANLAFEVCNVMKVGARKREEIYISAMLHDLGKSLIDKEILNKKTELNQYEWNDIKLHPEFGGMLASSSGLSIDIVENIIYHHENYDGTGYPRKIRGEEIPMGAAIIRICDTYDAMRMERPYKRAFSHDDAINEIKKEKYKYNPEIFTAFLRINFKIKFNGFYSF